MFEAFVHAWCSMGLARVEEGESLEARVEQLENQVAHLADTGGVLLLCGAFCALWAQNTGRNAWLWFFLGVFLNAIALIVLLAKNADDRRGNPPRSRSIP